MRVFLFVPFFAGLRARIGKEDRAVQLREPGKTGATEGYNHSRFHERLDPLFPFSRESGDFERDGL